MTFESVECSCDFLRKYGYVEFWVLTLGLALPLLRRVKASLWAKEVLERRVPLLGGNVAKDRTAFPISTPKSMSLIASLVTELLL